MTWANAEYKFSQMGDKQIEEELVSYLVDYQGWLESEARELVRSMDRTTMVNFLLGR